MLDNIKNSTISIIGTGKMGQIVAQILANNVKQVYCYNSQNPITLEKIQQTNSEIIVDCSLSQVFLQNLPLFLKTQQKIVVVCSGWYQELENVKNQVKRANGSLIFAKNYSFSLKIYKKLLIQACQLFQTQADFDVFGLEFHHRAKKDSPSGTTMALAETILDNFPAKKQILYDRSEGQIDPETLHFASVRGGENNIIHQIFFDNENEQIELKHSIKNRQAIVFGILQALEFIQHQSGFFQWDE